MKVFQKCYIFLFLMLTLLMLPKNVVAVELGNGVLMQGVNEKREINIAYGDTAEVSFYFPNESYRLTYCYSGVYNNAVIEGNTCKVTPDDYGSFSAYVEYSDGVTINSTDFTIITGAEEIVTLFKNVYFPNRDVSISELSNFNADFIKIQPVIYTSYSDCRINSDYVYTCSTSLGYQHYAYEYDITYTGNVTGLIPSNIIDYNNSVSDNTLYMTVGNQYHMGYYNTKNTDLVTYVKDESIISVDGSVITAKKAGETELIVYNIKNNQVHVRNVIINDAVFANNDFVYITSQEVQAKLDAMPSTVDIDVATLPKYWINYKEDTANYNQIASQYLLAYIFEGYDLNKWYPGFMNINASCENTTCTVNFEYDETNRGESYRSFTKTYTFNLTGMRQTDMTYVESEVTDEYANYYYLNNVFISFLKPIVIDGVEQENTITYSYDSSEILIEDDKIYFLTTGNVSLTVTSLSGYTHTYDFFVMISSSDMTEINNYHEKETKVIELDYYKANFTNNLDLLEYEVTQKYYAGFPLKYREYAQIDTVCLSEEKCIISLRSENDYIGSHTTKVKTITYNESNSDFTDIEQIVSKLKDLYVLTFDEYLNVNLASNGSRDTYTQKLINILGVSTLFANKSYSMEITNLKEFTLYDEVFGNIEFTFNIRYNDEIVYSKDIDILVNPMLNVSVEESYEEADQLALANTYLQATLGINSISCSFLNDDKTIMTANVNDEFTFNFIYNQPQRIDATSVYSKYNNYQLAIGEEKKVMLEFYPIDANYFANVEFSSSNEDVVTVDENGTIIGHSKGYAIITMKISKYNYSNVIVLVDMPIKDFLNIVAQSVNNNVEITYGDLRYQSMENALLNRVSYNYLNPEYNNIYNIMTEVEKIENNYYFTKNLYSNVDYQTTKSDPVIINYQIKGINVVEEYYNIKVGDMIKANLYFTEGDNSNLYYRNSNPRVATVTDSGRIIGLSKGVTRVDVLDKKSNYYNYFYVYVDLKDYVTEKLAQLSENVIYIEPSEYETAVNWRFISALQSLFPSYDYTDKEYNAECDEENKTCVATIEVAGVTHSQNFRYEVSGIIVKDIYNDLVIEKDGTYQINAINYTNLDDKNLYYESKQENICTVDENGLVTGVSKGQCIVVIKNAADNQEYLSFIVDAPSIAQDIEALYSELPNELDIKLLPYDSTLPDTYMNIEIYWTLVTNLLSGYLDDGYNYGFEFSFADMVDNELDVIVFRGYQYINKEEDIYAYNGVSAQNPKKIKLNFLEEEVVPDENLEKIMNSLKPDYTLSVLDALKYKISGEQGGMWKYCSEFINAVERYEGYSVFFDGRAGGSNSDYSSSEGGYFVITYEGAPVEFGEIWFTVMYNAEDNIPKTQEEFMRYLENLIRDTYLGLFDIPTGTIEYGESIPTNAREVLMPAIGRNNPETVDVTVTYAGLKGLNELYKIDVEDIQFGIEVARQTDEDYTYKVTNIVTNKTNLNLKVGAEETITYTITPENATDKTVTWTSSNNNVVKVQNGKVTAVGVGAAEITIKSNDGNFTKVIYVNVEASIKTGDVNNDGKININDLIGVRKHLAGITVLTGDKLNAADINKDGKVNINDVIRIRKFLAGLGNL